MITIFQDTFRTPSLRSPGVDPRRTQGPGTSDGGREEEGRSPVF